MIWPRKKVVSYYPIRTCINMFQCELECGHQAAAYGLTKKGTNQQLAPATMECRKCPKKPSQRKFS